MVIGINNPGFVGELLTNKRHCFKTSSMPTIGTEETKQPWELLGF